ncbi:MAG TPA: hypothetical protein VMW08_05395 [Acidimicrobiales bacterium]|nr:hypothetical protein [Acidimicrobiales bacterium]
MTSFVVEVRRCLHRRVVWVLVLLALGFGILGATISFFSSTGMSEWRLLYEEGGHPAAMVTWWNGPGEGIVSFAALFFLIGGLFGGASIVGAEWRAGTVTTGLTWEPRRSRFHLARVGACGACAFVIAVVLQVVFLALLSVAVITHGTTSGVDAAWWGGLVLAVLRISLLASIAAVVGASLATIGRNTAFGVMAVFAWMAVGENLVRGLRPSLEPHLFGENLSIVLTWAQLETVEFTRSPTTALAAVLSYGLIIGAVALVSFERRDITGNS